MLVVVLYHNFFTETGLYKVQSNQPPIHINTFRYFINFSRFHPTKINSKSTPNNKKKKSKIFRAKHRNFSSLTSQPLSVADKKNKKKQKTEKSRYTINTSYAQLWSCVLLFFITVQLTVYMCNT